MALRGIVLNDHERAEAARIAASMPGVDGVDNQLRLMSSTRPTTGANY